MVRTEDWKSGRGVRTRISLAGPLALRLGDEAVDEERQAMNQAPGRHPRRIAFARPLIGADRYALKRPKTALAASFSPWYLARATKMGPNIWRKRPGFCRAKST